MKATNYKQSRAKTCSRIHKNACIQITHNATKTFTLTNTFSHSGDFSDFNNQLYCAFSANWQLLAC